MNDEMQRLHSDIVKLLKMRDSLIEAYQNCMSKDAAAVLAGQIYDIHTKIKELRDG